MRVFGGDALANGGQSGVRRVSVLLFDDDARGLASNNIGRRQVRLAESEVYAARTRAVEDLPDHALLYPAQPCCRLECFFHQAILSSENFLPQRAQRTRKERKDFASFASPLRLCG